MFYRLFAAVFTVFVFFALVGIDHTQAQSAKQVVINQAEAIKLKKEIEKQLETYKGLGGISSSFIWDGDVMVEPAGTYYAVTLPDLKIIDHQQKQEYHVGMIAANIVPVRKKDAKDIEKWNLSVALPTPIFAHRSGKIVGQFDAAEQDISILWSPELSQMIDADIHLRGVELSDLTAGFSIFIDSFRLERNYKKDAGKNTWSGSDRYTLDNVSAQDANKHEVFKVKKSVTKSEIQSMDFKKIAEMQKKTEELVRKSANTNGVSTENFIDFIGQGLGLSAAQKAMFHLEDVYIFIAEKNQSFDVRTIDGLIEMTGQGTGFIKSKIWLENVISSTLGARGQKQISQHSPFNLVFDGALNNLPELKDFRKMIQQVPVQDAQGRPTAAQENAISIADLLVLLNKTGTLVRVNEIKAESPLSSVALTGNMTFHPDAQWGVQSNSVLTLTGLDQLYQALSAEGGPQAKETLGMIQVLQSMGRVVQKGSATQAEIITFTIDIGKEGSLLLNGTNIAPLLAMVAPQVQQQMQQQGR